MPLLMEGNCSPPRGWRGRPAQRGLSQQLTRRSVIVVIVVFFVIVVVIVIVIVIGIVIVIIVFLVIVFFVIVIGIVIVIIVTDAVELGAVVVETVVEVVLVDVVVGVVFLAEVERGRLAVHGAESVVVDLEGIGKHVVGVVDGRVVGIGTSHDGRVVGFQGGDEAIEGGARVDGHDQTVALDGAQWHTSSR